LFYINPQKKYKNTIPENLNSSPGKQCQQRGISLRLQEKPNAFFKSILG